MAYDCSVEEAELQKKLIPVNIVVCVLCLVAIISMLFTPFIKFDTKQLDPDVLTELSGGEVDIEVMLEELGLDIEIEEVLDEVIGDFSLTPIDVGKYAFSDESLLKPVIDGMVGLMNKFAAPMFDTMLLQQLFEVATDGLNLTELNEKFKALGNVHSEDEMRSAAAQWIAEINNLDPDAISPEMEDEIINMCVDAYNTSYELTGGISLESFICVLVSDVLFDLEEPVTGYLDVLDIFMGQGGEGAEGGSGFNDMMDSMYELEDQMLKPIAKAWFGTLMFPIVLWFILFLFSLLHIFAQNKRFMMWYVKLICCWPCIIYGILPTAAAGFLASMGGEMAIAASIVGCITSLTWISGACYLLLWGVSIFWAFPIKRKIRADRKG